MIGLTGGIGSGKSTAASLFREMGAEVVDADEIVRRLLDRPAICRKLAHTFGPGVVSRGRIDRAEVARRAFKDTDSIRRLNEAIHPHVHREINRRIGKNRRKAGITILDAALIHETGTDRLCDMLVFIDTPRAVRARRTAGRGWSGEEFRRRERAQWSIAAKRARADYTLKNNGNRTALRKQVRRMLEDIRERSRISEGPSR